MPWLAAATVAAPVVAGAIGSIASAGDRREQKKMIKRAMKELEKVGVPPDLSGPLLLQEFERTGIYTPELEEDLSSSMEESAVSKIQEDPELRKAQLDALTSMQSRGKVGLSAEDRAALNQVRNEVQRDAEAKRQQVLQSMQARGMGGSGASLVAQLQAGQDAAELASQQSDSTMAQAQQRALQAIGESSNIASGMRGQDFTANQARAQAIDERNRFLAENSIARQQRNVSSLNDAQRLNLEEQQRIAEINAAQANAEVQRQNQAKRDLFQDKFELAQAKANARLGAASAAGQRAQSTAQGIANIGTGIASGLAAYGASKTSPSLSSTGLSPDAAGGTTGYSRDYLASDKNLKEEITYDDAEVQAFMDRISKKFIKG